jgi:Protein of unknown function (DUF1549)/Protein of unknown function (DUF1553)
MGNAMRSQPRVAFWSLACVGLAIVPLTLGAWIYFCATAKVSHGNPVVAANPTVATPEEPKSEEILRAGLPIEEEQDDPMPDSPPVIGMPDPDLDKLVEKEAALEPPSKGKVNLAPIVRKADARTPIEVAKEVDSLIDRKLAESNVPASSAADDAEFLRRVQLDIVGVIPSAAKTRAFLADQTPSKRERLVEELLASPEFGDHFAHYWHELLVKRDSDNNRAIKTQDVFLKWMAHQFKSNRPWDEVVRSMLTASGDQALAGETFFILACSDNGQPAPNKIVGTASALFLGNQLMCAECHVHPYTAAWKQQDFWGLAAFFGKTRAERATVTKNPNDLLARIADEGPKPKGKGANDKPAGLPDGSIAIPDPRNDGKFVGAAKPKVLGGPVVAKDSVNRKFVADWYVSPSNPFFARASVNRLWSQFFARGFVNPLDDIRPDSEITHPEVLQLLAEEMVASKFDIKHMIRCLVSTQAYQRSSRTTAKNAADHELYSHMAMKVLPPRSLFHSLAVSTGDLLPVPGGDAPVAKKKENAPTGIGYFDVREYDESPAEYTYGVPHLLRLLNTKLPPACDAMAKVAMKIGDRDKIVEQLYLTTLSRMPTSAETRRALDYVGKQPDAEKGFSTLAWALLGSAEFINNH